MVYTSLEIDEILNKAPVMEPQRQFYFVDQCRKIISALEEEKGRKLTVCINTFGCQMNAKDSEKLLGIMEEIGYVESDSEDSDFVLYNTCTVREHANVRVYGRLGVLKNSKDKNPDMIIALCGCMMQENAVVEKIKQSYKHVDIIFGTYNIYKLAELLFLHFTQKKMQIEIYESPQEIVEDLPSERKYKFKSGVNIMYGCNNFCSYCIVPYVRGRERSREKEDILREIRNLAADGVIEIMLLGQNVNSYAYGFPQLLAEAAQIPEIKRIRFMTSHPKDLSDDLIRVIKDNPKIARHIHLPLQSGSTRVLKEMNRHYTKEGYLELVDKIRSEIKDISITTDIIVGFPGETEEDFQDTLDVVRKAKFESAFTFIYSKRSGTKAALMPDQIPRDIVNDRFNRLLALVTEGATKQTMRYTGQSVEVLVEEINQKDPSLLTGRMSNNSLVHFKGSNDLIGTMAKVHLDEAKGFYYLGTLIRSM